MHQSLTMAFIMHVMFIRIFSVGRSGQGPYGWKGGGRWDISQVLCGHLSMQGGRLQEKHIVREKTGARLIFLRKHQ